MAIFLKQKWVPTHFLRKFIFKKILRMKQLRFVNSGLSYHEVSPRPQQYGWPLLTEGFLPDDSYRFRTSQMGAFCRLTKENIIITCIVLK